MNVISSHHRKSSSRAIAFSKDHVFKRRVVRKSKLEDPVNLWRNCGVVMNTEIRIRCGLRAAAPAELLPDPEPEAQLKSISIQRNISMIGVQHQRRTAGTKKHDDRLSKQSLKDSPTSRWLSLIIPTASLRRGDGQANCAVGPQ